MPSPKLILVTGATGYVGGRLVPRLLEAGYTVRVLVRDATRLQGRAWLKQVEVITGDALQPETLTAALKDVAIAYYLIHGMQGGQVNADRDLQAARNFAEAASQANIERIIPVAVAERHRGGEAGVVDEGPVPRAGVLEDVLTPGPHHHRVLAREALVVEGERAGGRSPEGGHHVLGDGQDAPGLDAAGDGEDAAPPHRPGLRVDDLGLGVVGRRLRRRHESAQGCRERRPA